MGGFEEMGAIGEPSGTRGEVLRAGSAREDARSIDFESIFRRGFEEYREFVNPMIAHRAQMAGEPIRVTRVVDGLLRDEDGRTYEDLHGTQSFGHRHPAITAAVRAFLDSDAPNWYPSRVNPFAGRLARRLCERSGHYTNVYLGCSGSDVVEAGIKLARALTKKPRILGLEGAYHGCGVGSTALMTPGPFRDPFGPHLPGAEHLPFGDVDALARALAVGDVAAVLVEPVQGEGGVRVLPGAYVEAVCELTEKHGVLLIADEVQTGLGRLGRFLFTETWPRRPDAALVAKQLGGGLAPVSAMLTRRELFERAYGADFEDGESHNMTFSFNAMTASAALAMLDLLTPELMGRVVELGGRFRKELAEALSHSPLYREVRGIGLMCGVALHSPNHPWLSFEHFGYPELAGRSTISPLLCHRLYKHGFFAFTCGHDWSVFRLQPRYTIPAETLERLVRVIREEVDYIAGLCE